MSARSKIEWTDASWNPVTGCSKVSAGCKNCYAERMALRLRAMGSPKYAQGFEVALHPESLEEPVSWARGRRVFVCSMADLFHENVPDHFIDQVFGVMARCQQHTFIVLTKRARRMREYCTWTNDSTVIGPRDMAERIAWWTGPKRIPVFWPLRNVWLGVSAEDQKTADERIGHLVETPAAKRFVSLEPLLGPVDLGKWIATTEIEREWSNHLHGYLDWVIVGGESGPGARPVEVHWVRAIQIQCAYNGVPFFFKQWGKHIVGRLIDGVEWSQFPC